MVRPDVSPPPTLKIGPTKVCVRWAVADTAFQVDPSICALIKFDPVVPPPSLAPELGLPGLPFPHADTKMSAAKPSTSPHRIASLRSELKVCKPLVACTA